MPLTWSPQMGATLIYFNDRGGLTEKKNLNFRIYLPQKVTTFLAYQKKTLVFLHWKAKKCQPQLWLFKNKIILKTS